MTDQLKNLKEEKNSTKIALLKILKVFWYFENERYENV